MDPGKFDGKYVNVTGLVKSWSSTSENFTLVDYLDYNFTINITHDSGFPGGFGNDETVVVSGIYNFAMNKIESNSLQLGCPSKY
jgi:cytochrome c-type biogenesis protein CcmE